MPELPEVETMRRGIHGVIGGRIAVIERTRCRLKPIVITPAMKSFRRRVVGATITEVGRVGKRLVVWLDRGEAVVFEPRMTGLVLVADPPDQAHLRFRLRLSGAGVEQLLFWDRRGLGRISLLSRQQFSQCFSSAHLGPDALELSVDQLQDGLARSHRAIKVALLDQRAVAGIGNLYASEILHRASIHPTCPCHTLAGPDWQRLQRAMRQVMQQAIRYEGSTLSDGTYRNALNGEGQYQRYHRVYGRAGEICQSCGRGRIVRTVQSQRSTFFCPKCQSPRRKPTRRSSKTR